MLCVRVHFWRLRIKKYYSNLENLLLCIKGALGLRMSQFTKAALDKLNERKGKLGAVPRIIGKDIYTGVFTNGKPNGVGFMEYSNGDTAFGYWNDGMLDSWDETYKKFDDNRACVYYRASENASFFGTFDCDCGKDGSLFTASRTIGIPFNFTTRQLKIYDQNFWNKIIAEVSRL